jgi:hypothetical protein
MRLSRPRSGEHRAVSLGLAMAGLTAPEQQHSSTDHSVFEPADVDGPWNSTSLESTFGYARIRSERLLTGERGVSVNMDVVFSFCWAGSPEGLP